MTSPVYAAYDVAGIAAAATSLPILPWLWYRGLTEGLSQRLGMLPSGADELECRPIWMHAASVGETLAVLPLFELLRSRYPDVPWVVSTSTSSGRAVAEREMHPRVTTLLPVDALRCVDRVFDRLRPRVLIVAETEIWPGLLRAASSSGASIAYVSACMSERSLRRYMWIRPLIRAALAKVDILCAQSDADARRFRVLGVEDEAIRVTGNLKAGRQATVAEPALPDLGARPVLVAASTQPGEEDFVMQACESLWRSGSDALLILAPRRPERFDDVAQLLALSGIDFQRRSLGGSNIGADTKVLLVDTLGELASFFPFARSVFVGGTIAEIGGHNVLEPATAEAAVTFGPSVDNVRESAVALLAAGGAVEVRTPEALAQHWQELVGDEVRAIEMGRAAAAVARERSASLTETFAAIEPYVRGGQ